jgi:poly(rC)-binding protein 2/3/4
MAISSQHIGSVLGRGGCNISLARQVSGARIKLYPGAAGSRRTADRSVDSDRLLEISGSSEQVASAQDIIQRFIASSGAMLPEFASFTATGKQYEPETAMFVVS